MLEPKLASQGSFPAEDLSPRLLRHLSRYTPTHAQKRKLDHAVDTIATAVSFLSRGALDVAPFGSCAMGLETSASDVDLVLVDSRTRGHPEDGLPVLNDLVKELRARRMPGATLVGRPLLHTRIPHLVLRVGDVDVDLVCAENSNAPKTDLVRAYCNASPLARPLVLLVKLWAKARGLVDASVGKLNSWTLVLLVLHYLHARHGLPVLQPSSPLSPGFGHFVDAHRLPRGPTGFQPLAPEVIAVVPGHGPSAAAAAAAEGLPPGVDRLFDVGGMVVGPGARKAFAALPASLRTEVLGDQSNANAAPAAALPLWPALRGFFQYYSQLDAHAYAVSVRRGHLLWAAELRAPASEGGVHSTHKDLLVEDPFDPQDNTARSLRAEHCASFFAELARAEGLARAGDVEGLMRPLKESVSKLDEWMRAYEVPAALLPVWWSCAEEFRWNEELCLWMSVRAGVARGVGHEALRMQTHMRDENIKVLAKEEKKKSVRERRRGKAVAAAATQQQQGQHQAPRQQAKPKHNPKPQQQGHQQGHQQHGQQQANESAGNKRRQWHKKQPE
jgi:DNA polymerase sigma